MSILAASSPEGGAAGVSDPACLSWSGVASWRIRLEPTLIGEFGIWLLLLLLLSGMVVHDSSTCRCIKMSFNKKMTRRSFSKYVML